MEWRQQTTVSCTHVFTEAQRWIEEVTGKSFGCNDFRAALENGVLLCDLINQLKPGIVKRVNRLSTPIAGLDNVNVFLTGCEKLGLNESQLFHPGDLQDLSTRATLRRDESSRRLKNVLITIYWLGRKAHLDTFYNGPQLNLKAFEGLLGLALSKALEDGGHLLVKDGLHRECQCAERDECQHLRLSYKRENSTDSTESPDTRTPRPNTGGCGSDAEAEQVFKMESTQQNNDRIPTPLLRSKQAREEKKKSGTCASTLSRHSCTTLYCSTVDAPLSPEPHLTVSPDEHVIDDELFLQTSSEEDSEEDYTDPDPVLDDLYFRRVQQTHHRTSTNTNYDRFLPQQWTPEEETRVRKIYLGSQTRPWYRKMLNLRACQIQVRPERPLQVNPGWIWSKSLNDIPMLYPVRKVSDGTPVYDEGQRSGLARQWSQENKRKCFVAAKDSEAQWQDDFTKWKNRRRSTKGDLRMKSQDREHVINQMTNGAVNYEKDGAQRGLVKRDQLSPRKHNAASQPYSASPPSKSLSSDLRPHTRAPLTRSYATEAAFSPSAPLSHHNSAHTWELSLGAMPASDGGNIRQEETYFASLASDGARIATPSLDCHFSSRDQVRVQDSPTAPQSTSELTKPGNVFISQISTFLTTIKPNETAKATSIKNSTVLLSSHEKQSMCVNSEVKTQDLCPDAANNRDVNALEDLSHQNHSKFPEESKLSYFDPAAVKTKTQQAASVYKYMSGTSPWSGSASLPRGYRRSDSSPRLSSAITARPFVTKQSTMSSLPRLCRVDDNQDLLLNTEKDSSPTNSAPKRQTATVYLRSQQSSVRQRKAHQAKQVSTEQGSSASPFTQGSFQLVQPHLLPQPYSNLPHHRNKSLSSPSNGSTDPGKVDRRDMRVSLTLKPNSIPGFGLQTHWDSTGARVKSVTPGSPAELCRLCVNDEIVALDGVLVARMSYSQWKDKMASASQTGELTMDIRRYGYKDWNACEENHHIQPGRSLMTLNLTAASPVLIGCPDHCEAAYAKVPKCNAPTDDVIQDEVMSGVLSDNPRTARSKGGSESAISDLQVPSLSPSSSSWSWDREEDRRRQEKWQEEQERLLQEQYQRDQERLEAEWQKAQQEAMDGRKSGNTLEMMADNGRHVSSQFCINGQSMKTREKQSPYGEELNMTRATSPSHVKGVQSDGDTQNGWAKSLSTSVLADAHKQTRGDQRKSKGQQMSRAEQDRQQILEEMKKRTQLLTDNSWIRKRSSSFYKEPVYTGVPMKRYESLDNLDSLRRSPSLNTTLSYSRPHSAAAGYCAPSRNSYSRYSTGTIPSQRNTSIESSHHGSAGAAIDISEEHRRESRFESETGSPIVNPSVTNSSPLMPSAFDQHAVLEIEE